MCNKLKTLIPLKKFCVFSSKIRADSLRLHGTDQLFFVGGILKQN